ncbi:MAG TPA: OmpW family outer membrane protein [Rugosibacter sp.]
MNIFNRCSVCLTVVAVLFSILPASAYAGEGNWMVRVRAIKVAPDNKSDAGNGNTLNTSNFGPVPAISAIVPENFIKISNEVVPEIDISYFFSSNIAAEVLLGGEIRHNVGIAKGPLMEENIGQLKYLAPTVILQYHFLPDGFIRPYVGLGINYTHVTSYRLRSSVAGADINIDKNSVGAALQAGVDIKLNKQLYLNFDAKKIQVRTDLNVGGTKFTREKVDPLVLGIGLGYRF